MKIIGCNCQNENLFRNSPTFAKQESKISAKTTAKVYFNRLSTNRQMTLACAPRVVKHIQFSAFCCLFGSRLPARACPASDTTMVKDQGFFTFVKKLFIFYEEIIHFCGEIFHFCEEIVHFVIQRDFHFTHFYYGLLYQFEIYNFRRKAYST